MNLHYIEILIFKNVSLLLYADVKNDEMLMKTNRMLEVVKFVQCSRSYVIAITL